VPVAEAKHDMPVVELVVPRDRNVSTLRPWRLLQEQQLLLTEQCNKATTKY